MKNPLKRIAALQSFSRDHHHTLLLCWKIKTGIKKGIAADRIKTYTDWFYRNHLIKHFINEEKYLYPVLGSEHKLIQQAIVEHELLTRLFTDKLNSEESLKKIPAELERHIRFEERTLFDEIQTAATGDQLQKFNHLHSKKKFVDNLCDEFWL